MVQVQSKLTPIRVSCNEYVHPWTDSCLEAITGCYLYAVIDSFRIYATFYLLALLMKGKMPTKKDIKRTLHGILQSTAFLSGTAFGYSLFLCTLRRILGHFNLLTVSAAPAFLSSVFAILIERPSRRLLLSLYVSNVATETLWNMGLSRKLVHPVKYGETAMFSICMAILLYYFKGGFHKKSESDKGDSMFGVLRFILGPYEEKDYMARSRQTNTFFRQRILPNNPSTSGSNGGGSWTPRNNSTSIYHLVTRALRSYKQLINKVKCLGRHPTCPHPFSCLYYTMQGAGKMITVGLGIQVAFKFILNIKRIFKSPKILKVLFYRRDVLSLAAFLGGFAGLFRLLSCILRHSTGTDNALYAIPAGLVAGIAFQKYPDTTVALYVLWKTAQITYTLGIDKGVLPKVPGFTEFLYCFSTATLFHAALLEPIAIRPSYWKFLHSLSGGRVACMNRNPLDVWGLDTSQALQKVLLETNTEPVVQFYSGCACS